MRDTIERTVNGILREHLGLGDDYVITAESKICDDLGGDDLDILEIAMALDEEYGIEISDDELGEAGDANITVGHFYGFVRKHRSDLE